ncbi:dienelactone hydrolase family protein [Microlunatus ginsengisoli]|uniref:Dienelactone hydrolase family protein n=1 Tax=Microlunatus ginsengisoli TaxID=363863 RepID=A0ABP7AF65_9ACTN
MDVASPQTVDIRSADGPMPAQLWHPPAGSGPAVVVFQEIFGVTDYIRRRCADLARLGYVVCAPEIYWRLGEIRIEDGPDAMTEAMAALRRLDWPAAVRDGVAALEHVRGLIEVTGPVALLGFCFGGGLAFNVAADDAPDALVSYYGSALPTLLDRAPDVTAPSLHHFGLADSFIPAEVVDQIRDAVTRSAQARFETYDGAGHAFDNPNPMFHHPAASAAAWGVTTRFLAEILGAPSPDAGW